MRLQIISIIALISISLSVNAQTQKSSDGNEAASKRSLNYPPSSERFVVSGSMKGYTAKRIIHMSGMGTNYVQERDTPPI